MLPVAREEGITAQEFAGEWVVYDLERDRAHRLNPAAALVWRHCDGTRDVQQLAALLNAKLGLPKDERLARLALDSLAKAELLRELPAAEALGRLSRRQLVKRLGIGLAALPLVATLVAPDAMAAGSCVGNNANCTNRPCCRGFVCVGGKCQPG
jgi:hypothetical protein